MGLALKNYFIADFDGDKISDIMVRTNKNELKLYPSRTEVSTGFLEVVKKLGMDLGFPQIFINDFSGDGVADLIGRLPNGDLILPI